MYLYFGDPLAHFKAHGSWGRHAGVAGLINFSKQFSHVCRTHWSFDAALLGILSFIYQPALISMLQRVDATWRDRALLAAALGLVLVACFAVAWSGPARSFRVIHTIYHSIYEEQDNLAFALFLGLGLSMWLRRGAFWGCLVLVPIALGAVSGEPLSMRRFVLMSYPAFIEAAELTRGRWLSLAIVLLGLYGQSTLLYLFTEMRFVG